MGRRTQAERDAITVETGYALVSAVLVAAVAFGAIAGPKLLFAMPYTAERGLLISGVRGGRGRLRGARRDRAVALSRPGRPIKPGQPSQPGRTSPDS